MPLPPIRPLLPRYHSAPHEPAHDPHTTIKLLALRATVAAAYTEQVQCLLISCAQSPGLTIPEQGCVHAALALRATPLHTLEILLIARGACSPEGLPPGFRGAPSGPLP